MVADNEHNFNDEYQVIAKTDYKFYCFRSTSKANKIQLRHTQTFRVCELFYGHDWDAFTYQLQCNI